MRGYAQYDKKFTESKPPNSNGHYQCYCKKYGNVGMFNEPEELCSEYYNDKGLSYISKISISIVIVIINVVVRQLNIMMVNKIGYNTRSQTVGGITLLVFFSQFINIGFVLAISNANLKYTWFAWTHLTESPFTDFT